MNCQDGYCGAEDCKTCFPWRDYDEETEETEETEPVELPFCDPT